MSPYRGIDYYDLDSLLSEDELAIREMVHDFVQNEFMPVIHEHHKNETFPTEMIGRLGELGLLGSNLPEEYGCAGINSVAYGFVMHELERGDSGLRSFASVQGALVMYPSGVLAVKIRRRSGYRVSLPAKRWGALVSRSRTTAQIQGE